MDSSVSMRGRSRVVPKEELDNHLNLKPSHLVLKSHPSGTTPSFSSSSSASSSSSSFSSVLPPSAPLLFSGVPFSWEKTPGIPKKLSPSQGKDKDEGEDEDESSADLRGRSLLPLPPLVTPPSSQRFSAHDDMNLGKKVLFPGDAGEWYQWDPFVTALVECSKEEGYHYCNGGKSIGDREKGSRLWNGRRVSRSIIDRFSFLALYACSCKRASPTSKSIIYLPRSSTSSFIVTNGRSR